MRADLHQDASKPPTKKELTPFQRFEDVARRIIAVPKAEIDELEAKDPRGPNGTRAKS